MSIPKYMVARVMANPVTHLLRSRVLRPLINRIGDRRYLRFEYTPEPLSSGSFDALARRPRWQRKTLTVAPGIQLRGLMRAPRETSAPVVVFFAGNGDNLLEGSQSFVEGSLPSAVGSLVFAYRGFDGSDGVPEQSALYEDAVKMMREARSLFPGHPIHVVGFSLGTHLAAYAAAHDHEIESLTLVAGFTTIDIVRRSPFRRFLRPDRFETLALLAQVSVPVHIIHGACDEALPVAHADALAEGRRKAGIFEVLPGRKHVETLTDPETSKHLEIILGTGARLDS